MGLEGEGGEENRKQGKFRKSFSFFFFSFCCVMKSEQKNNDKKVNFLYKETT